MANTNYPLVDFTGETCLNADDIVQNFTNIDAFISCVSTLIESYGVTTRFSQQFTVDGTTNVFSITENGGVIPAQSNEDYIIDLNGTILTDALSTGNTRAVIDEGAGTISLVDDAGNPVLSGSVPDPDILTVRFFVTTTFQDLLGCYT